MSMSMNLDLQPLSSEAHEAHEAQSTTEGYRCHDDASDEGDMDGASQAANSADRAAGPPSLAVPSSHSTQNALYGSGLRRRTSAILAQVYQREDELMNDHASTFSRTAEDTCDSGAACRASQFLWDDEDDLHHQQDEDEDHHDEHDGEHPQHYEYEYEYEDDEGSDAEGPCHHHREAYRDYTETTRFATPSSSDADADGQKRRHRRHHRQRQSGRRGLVSSLEVARARIAADYMYGGGSEGSED